MVIKIVSKEESKPAESKEKKTEEQEGEEELTKKLGKDAKRIQKLMKEFVEHYKRIFGEVDAFARQVRKEEDESREFSNKGLFFEEIIKHELDKLKKMNEKVTNESDEILKEINDKKLLDAEKMKLPNVKKVLEKIEPLKKDVDESTEQLSALVKDITELDQKFFEKIKKDQIHLVHRYWIFIKNTWQEIGPKTRESLNQIISIIEGHNKKKEVIEAFEKAYGLGRKGFEHLKELKKEAEAYERRGHRNNRDILQKANEELKKAKAGEKKVQEKLKATIQKTEETKSTTKTPETDITEMPVQETPWYWYGGWPRALKKGTKSPPRNPIALLKIGDALYKLYIYNKNFKSSFTKNYEKLDCIDSGEQHKTTNLKIYKYEPKTHRGGEGR